MREPTLARSHTVAVTATMVLLINFIAYVMREYTLGRSRTVAVTATRLLQRKMIFFFMREELFRFKSQRWALIGP